MRRTLLIISSILVVLACASLPDKPTVQICVIDWPRKLALCGLTRQSTSLSDVQSAKSIDDILSEIEPVPLATMDKGVVMSPPNWEKVQNYIHTLQAWIETQCKGN